MGKSLKRKMKLLVPEDQGAVVLRAVADGLESGAMEFEGQQVPLEGFTSLGLSLKRSDEGLGVKLKIKFPAPEETLDESEGEGDSEGDDDNDDDDNDEDDDDEDESASGKPPPGKKLPRYSSLKKWMEKEFKAIMAELVQGRLPDTGLAASFVEDSRSMVLYPGKGDEYYPVYTAAVDAFEQAMFQGSLENVAAAVADLQAIKEACHDKYE